MVAAKWEATDDGTIEISINGQLVARYCTEHKHYLIDGMTTGLVQVINYFDERIVEQNKRIEALENHPAMQAWKYKGE